ncbi:MAG: nitrilase family protein [Planctomycetota bacterium]
MRDVRVAAVQFEHTPGKKDANLEKIQRFTAEAARQGVEILCFPECCITGYWFLRKLSREEIASLAERVPEGPSSSELLSLAKAHSMTIGAGLVEIDRNGALYNSFVVAMPDGRFARHRKLHAFVSEHISSGSEYTVFDSPHGCRLGVLTCYDNNIFENVRITALGGAEVLLAPHQTGGCRTTNPNVMGLIERRLWEERKSNPRPIEAEFRGDKGRGWLMRWLPAHAHDNNLFLLFANGVGVDDDEIRTGNAMVLDPFGRVISETWKADDWMVVADLQAELRDKSTGEGWLRARRPELYEPLTVPTGREISTRAAKFGME